ncbi:ferritin-like domain-containing protein [Terrihabitans rhizophilus]|uniref:Ferritin-like domain-containing protein n=1 Tax=Terrihabitans rhizophilus TaxID=3092662 RepID=A0ABU4RTL3_9HYPH|nr:ferritin-like domain-containing protein [Terrihabitans sp. PJ23]MDX6806970.1 ferritin-like domain-containing protein [Terrihabitans sp. PJ23]
MADTYAHELYITALRNAHALENQALSIMKPQISRLENYPDVLRQLEMHSAETEQQITRLEGLLQNLNETHSALKDTALSFSGAMAALGHSVAGDEILKNTFANYAFENFEIASYKSLITLAEASGNTRDVSALEQTLGEEIAMASWIENNIEPVTRRFLMLSEQGHTAKV